MTDADAAGGDPSGSQAADTAAKHELRRVALAVRGAMDPTEREQARAAVRSVVVAQCTARGWARVAAYVPLRTEPGSAQLLTDLAAHGVDVIVPLTLPDRDLDWARWSPGALGAPMGRDAVAGVDAVLAPALTVARDGTRLGRGGGSYDRALARCPQHVVVAALLYDGELVDALPRAPWDRAVHAVAMPSGWVALP